MVVSLATLSKVRELCQQYDIKPQKKLGQNFLVDANVARKVVWLAQLKKEDQVVEVGGGLGALTELVAPQVKKLIVYEIDKRLVEVLKELFSADKSIAIYHGDILKVQDKDLAIDYKIVANLPYQITSFFLRHFLERTNHPQEILLIMQKELAERIVAKDGKNSLLSLAVNFYSQPEIIGTISSNCFWPKPKVDSAIIRFTQVQKKFNLFINDQEQKLFFKIIKAAFSAKRRQIHNNLSTLNLTKEQIENILLKSKISKMSRAEDLKIEDFMLLTKIFKNVVKNK